MLRVKEVLSAFFAEFLGSINEENTTIWIILLQNNNARRNASREENPSRKPNDSLDIALLEQFFANRTFNPTTEQDTVRKNNAHRSGVL